MHKDIKWILDAIEAAAETGVSGREYWRATYTKQDAAVVKLLSGYMKEAGMETYSDAVGNLFGRIQGRQPGLIMSGSHRDTVRDGGKYDGMLGVLTALKAAASLYEEYGSPRKTVEVVATCEEESSRFSVGYLGSHHICGFFREDQLDALDPDEITLRDAMRNAGYTAGPLSEGRDDLEHFIELHIEQGGLLENRQKQVGLVTSIVGLYCAEITLAGHQNHAGTTPMYMRKDPMPVAAAFITKLYDWAYQYMDDMVCTVGKFVVQPGNLNVIANDISFTIDIRSSSDERIRQADAEIKRITEELNGNIEVTMNLDSYDIPVPLDSAGVSSLEKLAAKRGLAYEIMPSGAGHDSQVIARKYPTNMIFVPSVEGISHNPAEYTRPEDIEAGYLLLRDYLKELAW